MSSDYILRSDAINALTVSALLRNLDSVEDGTAHRYRRAAERIIAGVPAADVVPVVRCKDCRHTKTIICDGAIYCWIWDKWEMPPNAYCYLGEKRKAEPPKEENDDLD